MKDASPALKKGTSLAFINMFKGISPNFNKNKKQANPLDQSSVLSGML